MSNVCLGKQFLTPGFENGKSTPTLNQNFPVISEYLDQSQIHIATISILIAKSPIQIPASRIQLESVSIIIRASRIQLGSVSIIIPASRIQLAAVSILIAQSILLAENDQFFYERKRPGRKKIKVSGQCACLYAYPLSKKKSKNQGEKKCKKHLTQNKSKLQRCF